jgi:hypothetical protein
VGLCQGQLLTNSVAIELRDLAQGLHAVTRGLRLGLLCPLACHTGWARPARVLHALPGAWPAHRHQSPGSQSLPAAWPMPTTLPPPLRPRFSFVLTSAAAASVALYSAGVAAADDGVQRIVVGEDTTLVTKALDRLSRPRGNDYGARVPAVLVGAARDLPLMDKWSPEHFASVLTQPLSNVKFSKRSSTFAYWGKAQNEGGEKYAQVLGHTNPYTSWDTLSISATELAEVAAKQVRVRKNCAELVFHCLCNTENDHFTKTGLGQR